MSDKPGNASDLASDLRLAFDQVFAVPPQARIEEFENLLALRIRGDLFALDVREIAGVEAAGTIVPLPSASPGCLGITGIRGGLVPVYSLALLLGYQADRDGSRLLAIPRTPDALALAMGDFEGYLRIPKSHLHEPQDASRKHVHRFADVGSTVRAVVSVPSVVAMIRNGAGPASVGR